MGKRVIHVIIGAKPLCHPTNRNRDNWPNRHSWVFANCAEHANCAACLGIYNAIATGSPLPQVPAPETGTVPTQSIPTYVWPLLIIFLIASALCAAFREEGFHPWVSSWLVRLILAPIPFFAAWACAWRWKREWYKPFMWAAIASTAPAALLIYAVITATGA